MLKSAAVLMGASLLVSQPVHYHPSDLSGARLHVVEVDPRHPKVDIYPVLAEKGQTLKRLAALHQAHAVINGGYFNLDNGQSVSSIIRHGRLIADPRDNRGLMNNPQMKPFLTQILQRSELRVLTSGAGLSLAIASPLAAVPDGLTLRDSLGAGPRLLPALRVVEEGFVAYGSRGERLRDAIMAYGPAKRSAVGLLPSGNLLLVASETGLTLPGMQQVMRQLGCHEALNLDGGSSTGIVVKQGNGYFSPLPDHWVRSALVIGQRQAVLGNRSAGSWSQWSHRQTD